MNRSPLKVLEVVADFLETYISALSFPPQASKDDWAPDLGDLEVIFIRVQAKVLDEV
ncbi:MAG: hypothetical protein O7H41_04070 [Planctomycetota bacterium]|nr:hypothetical protein [Planctomycetota bacterium]